MIEIGGNTILVRYQDGSCVPFDAGELEGRIESARLASGVELPYKRFSIDAALAVEYVLTRKADDVPDRTIPAETADAVTVKVLENAGMYDTAKDFIRNSSLRNESLRVPFSRLKLFIGENLALAGARLETITKKVSNAMETIGADASSPVLVTELAKHFLALADNGSPAVIKVPDFSTPDRAEGVTAQEILAKTSASEKVAPMTKERILLVHSIDLKIFPSVRLDVRLTGLAKMYGIEAPATELAMAQGLVRLADAIDEVCLASDFLCRAHGINEDALPLKLILNFADAEVFTGDVMGCRSSEESEKCSAALAEQLCAELTRVPFKVTCSSRSGSTATK